MNKTKVALSLCMALGLTACGGGGGGDAGAGAGGSADSAKTIDDLKLNLTGAVSVIVSSNVASDDGTRAKSMSGLLADTGTEKVFTFHETSPESIAKMSGAQAKEGASPQSNLFIIKEDGTVDFAFDKAVDMKVSTTLLSDNGKTLYFALDFSDWNRSYQLIEKTSCAIFKYDFDTNSTTCVEEGQFLETQNYWNYVNDTRFKPMQLDGEGRLYYFSRPFTVTTHQEYDYSYTSIDVDYNVTPQIRRSSPDGNGRYLTSDNEMIDSFVVTKSNSMVYRSNGKLNVVLNLDNENPTTLPTTDDVSWFAVDDNDTIIYSATNNNGKPRLKFIQPASGDSRLVNDRELDFSSVTGSNGWINRLIMGDDGKLYAVVNENQWSMESGSTDLSKLYQILPQKQGALVEAELTSDWWSSLNMEVAKGHVFYVEEEEQRGWGTRSVIKVNRLADGKESTLLNGEWAENNYKIDTWRLSGDVIFFTGMDNNATKMISGEIDTLALRSGKDKSEYLTIKEAASVHGASLDIADMEMIKPRRPEYEGGTPYIIKHHASVEDRYSSSLEFSKWMNYDSIEQHTQTTDLNGTEIATMFVWLNKTAHLLYDTNPQAEVAQPLAYGSSYTVTISGDALDGDGFDLVSGMGSSDISYDMKTLPEQGMYIGESAAKDGITDGQVLRAHNGSLRIEAMKVQTNDLDHIIEFSAPLDERLQVEVGYQASSGASYKDGNVTWHQMMQNVYYDKNGVFYREEWNSNRKELKVLQVTDGQLVLDNSGQPEVEKTLQWLDGYITDELGSSYKYDYGLKRYLLEGSNEKYWEFVDHGYKDRDTGKLYRYDNSLGNYVDVETGIVQIDYVRHQEWGQIYKDESGKFSLKSFEHVNGHWEDNVAPIYTNWAFFSDRNNDGVIDLDKFYESKSLVGAIDNLSNGTELDELSRRGDNWSSISLPSDPVSFGYCNGCDVNGPLSVQTRSYNDNYSYWDWSNEYKKHSAEFNRDFVKHQYRLNYKDSKLIVERTLTDNKGVTYSDTTTLENFNSASGMFSLNISLNTNWYGMNKTAALDNLKVIEKVSTDFPETLINETFKQVPEGEMFKFSAQQH